MGWDKKKNNTVCLSGRSKKKKKKNLMFGLGISMHVLITFNQQ